MAETVNQRSNELSPPIRELIDSIERLAEIAESIDPPAVKLGRLCTQLGAALFWVEQIRRGVAEGPLPPVTGGPHWQTARGRQPGEGRPVEE